MSFPSDYLKRAKRDPVANFKASPPCICGETGMHSCKLTTAQRFQPNLTRAIDALYLRQRAAKEPAEPPASPVPTHEAHADAALSTPRATPVEHNDYSRPLHIEIGRCGDVWLRVPVIDEWQEPGYSRIQVTDSSQALVNLWPTMVTHDADFVAEAVAAKLNLGKV